MKIVAWFVVLASASACALDPTEHCMDNPSYDAVAHPPKEWLTMSCEDACRLARKEGLLAHPNATTSCSFETDHGPALGQGEPWLRCNSVVRQCTHYE